MPRLSEALLLLTCDYVVDEDCLLLVLCHIIDRVLLCIYACIRSVMLFYITGKHKTAVVSRENLWCCINLCYSKHKRKTRV